MFFIPLLDFFHAVFLLTTHCKQIVNQRGNFTTFAVHVLKLSLKCAVVCNCVKAKRIIRFDFTLACDNAVYSCNEGFLDALFFQRRRIAVITLHELVVAMPVP